MSRYATRAQFHLLSTQICLAWNYFLDKKKQDYRNKFRLLHIACYWYSAAVCLSWKSRGNFVGKSCYCQGRNVMLSKILCLAALWYWALLFRSSIRQGKQIANGYKRQAEQPTSRIRTMVNVYGLSIAVI